MKPVPKVAVAIALAGVLTWTLPVSAGEVRTVTLSSGGLAEVHRSAQVTGADTITLEVPLAQVDDVLKSLVVRDPAGTVTYLTLGGPSPIDETFRQMPFTQAQLASVAGLADALRGTRLRASSGGRQVEGTGLGVTQRRIERSGEFVQQDVLSVMTSGGSVETLPLDADAILDILNPEMAAKIADAADALGRGRTEGTRTVVVEVSGDTEREVVLSYVVPAPVWKTAYRVVLDEADRARLQAWAVIENATGVDWQDVDVRLSSGVPVTLRQRLHDWYWAPRHEVPVTSVTGPLPRPDTGAAAHRDADVAARAGRTAQAPSSLAMEAAEPAFGDAVGTAPSAPTWQAMTQEGAVTTVFEIAHPVSLPAGDTLSVPIVDAAVPARRISLFQPDRGDLHPVAAVMIENNTAASLPPGLLTVYDPEAGYLGDAQIFGLPVGEECFASFASDRKVEVASQVFPETAIASISVVDGVIRTSVISRQVTRYSVKGASDEPRTVVIEHPIANGWTFSSDHHVSSTATHHRLEVALDPGEREAVVATAERTIEQSVAFADVDRSTLLSWSNAAIDPELADKLAALAELRREVSDTQTEVKDAEANVRRIAEDQNRVRQNFSAVPAQSALAARYLSRMEELEDMIELARERQARAERELRAREAAFATALRDL